MHSNATVITSRIAATCLAFIAFTGCDEQSGSPKEANGSTFEPLPTVATDPTGPRQPQPVADDVAKFVPSNGEFFAYVAEPAKLLESVRALAANVRPGTEGLVSADMLLGQLGLGVRSRELDLAAPMGFTGTSDRGPIAIMAAPDSSAITDIADGPTALSGRHVAVALGADVAPERAATPSAIAQALPAGDLALRLNLAELRDEVAEIRQQFEQMAAQVPDAEVVLTVYGPMLEFLETAEGFVDITIDIDGGTLHLSAAHDTGRGTGTKPTYRTPELFTKLRSSSSSIAFASNADLMRIYDLIDYEDLLESMPMGDGADREAMLEVYRSQVALFRTCAGPMAGVLDFTEDGMRGAFVLASDGPEKAVETFRENIRGMQTMFGGKDLKTSQITHAGTSFQLSEFEVDAEQMLAATGSPTGQPGAPPVDAGKIIEAIYGNPMRMAFGEIDGLAVISIGEDTEGIRGLIDRFRAGTTPDPEVLEVLASPNGAAGSDPIMMMRMDVAKMLERFTESGAFDSMGLPPLNTDTSAPMDIVISSRGGRYRLDLTVDVGGFASLFSGR